MRIQQLNKKLILSDLSNPEKLAVRRTCVNVKASGTTIVLDDNLFNRMYLGYKPEAFYEEESYVGEDELNPLLRDYQRADVLSMLKLKNVLNRNKPGYGKTFEAIEYCRLKGFKNILVICPKSVVTQWKYQFEQWWPNVEPTLASGGMGAEGGICITNYEQLTPRNVAPKGSRRKVLQPSQLWLKCKARVWDIIILDESHRIKNAQAQITIAIKDLPSMHRMCLTGTPILGHPDDLWSQLHFLDPRWSGGNLWAFVDRFCEIEETHWGRKPIGLTPSKNAQELLAKVLATISVGGENHKVTQGKNFIEIKLPMDTAQRNLYKDIVNLSLDNLEEKGVTVKNAMDQIIKQQQVTTNCTKFQGCKHNPKFEWLRDWLEDNEGERLVVFTKFAETAKALQEFFTKSKIKSVLYIGEMSGTERLKAVKSFVQPLREGAEKALKGNAAPVVIIGTIGALGTGVDGLQHVCSNVVFLDRDWTPGINEQAEDRVNRSGQVGMTNVWILNMEKSIDEYVDKIQGKKAEDIEEVFRRVAESKSNGAGSGQ